jgi:hypothetical protein
LKLFREQLSVNDLVMAKLKGLLEGFDLYEVPFDDKLANLTVEEVMTFKDAQMRDGGRSISVAGAFETIDGLLLKECRVSRDTVKTEVERRLRARPKGATVTNVYHLTGPGSRVNVNSVDNSTNLTITESQLFSKLRKEITANVQPNEKRDRILEKIEALEKEPNSRSLWDRYTELVAVAADHMTLLCPFIPALTEWIKNGIG